MILTKLIRPLIRWAAVAAAVILVVLGLLWCAGRLLIGRAEPVAVVALPDGVPGRLLTVGGKPVHVVEQGEGKPVVLVHGFAGTTSEWEETILAPLAQSHRVIAVDLFGMGFSERLDETVYDYDVWANQLVGLLDALDVERADFVGHSLGAAVIAVLAADHPERVERLVFLGPLVPLDDDERATKIEALKVPGVGEAGLGFVEIGDHPGATERSRERSGQAHRIEGSRDALLSYVRDGEDFAQLYEAHPRIQAPVLIIHGEHDDMVPWAAVRRAAPRIQHATVLPLRGGHFPHREHTERVAQAVAEFLDTPAPE